MAGDLEKVRNVNPSGDKNTKEKTDQEIQRNSTKTHSNLTIFLVLTFQNVASISGIFINKWIFYSLKFTFPQTLNLIQLLLAAVCLLIARITGFLALPSNLPIANRKHLFLPSLLWLLNVNVGLFALKTINVPMFSTLRRLGVIFVMLLEYFLYSKTYSIKIIISVVVIAFGSMISALTDLTFDMTGYIVTMINNAITALYFIQIKTSLQLLELNSIQLYYYCVMVSLPMTLALSLMTDYYDAVTWWAQVPKDSVVGVITIIIMSGFIAFSINYGNTLANEYTTPLTASVSGQLKNFFQTLGGMLFFDDYKYTHANALGLLIGCLGGVMYSHQKYVEQKSPGTDNSEPSSNRDSASMSMSDDQSSQEASSRYTKAAV